MEFMLKPKALVFTGYGLNCEEETAFAFETAGAKADIVHINDLIEKKSLLDRYQIMAVPGGFSYGDDTGSGNAYAAKIRNHLWDKIQQFISKDKLVIGICNGCQILTHLGVFGEVAFTHNDNRRYTDTWIELKVENKSPWLADIESFDLPIAHGEGKFVADQKTLNNLKKQGRVALRYMGVNPNGSLDDIAGITDKTGRILGLMPHPERAMFFTQLPDWPLQKEKLIRNNLPLPKLVDGIKIFQNAVSYFK